MLEHTETHTHLAGILPREQSIDVREQALASSQSLFSKQTQNTPAPLIPADPSPLVFLSLTEEEVGT